MTMHPEFPLYPLADMPALPDGWQDKSWRNDLCPVLHNPESGLWIWCDYAAPAMREHEESPRFIVMRSTLHHGDCGRQLGDDSAHVLFTGDAWGEVQDFLDHMAMPGATIEEAALGARMRLNQLTVADARQLIAAEIAHGEAGGQACPDLIAGMQAIIDASE